MSAAKYDLVIEQGATFRLSIVWKQPDTTPVNLTGWTARMQVRRRAAAEPALLTLTSDTGGGITLGTTSGSVAIIATPTQTSAINIKSGAYDLELTAPSGDVTRLLEGAVAVDWEVTK